MVNPKLYQVQQIMPFVLATAALFAVALLAGPFVWQEYQDYRYEKQTGAPAATAPRNLTNDEIAERNLVGTMISVEWKRRSDGTLRNSIGDIAEFVFVYANPCGGSAVVDGPPGCAPCTVYYTVGDSARSYTLTANGEDGKPVRKLAVSTKEDGEVIFDWINC